MPLRRITHFAGFLPIWALAAFAASAPAQPAPEAAAAFNSYVALVDSRLDEQRRTPGTFLATADPARLRPGQPIVESLAPVAGAGPPGSLIHDWRATAFAPGATAAQFEHLLRDFDRYPERFAPQVVGARVLGQEGDHAQVWMRVRQHHGLTAILDATYDVTFGRLDATHGFSTSRSVQIARIEPGERAFDGLLWRQNTYWSWEERDGGLCLQLESVSLTRSVPRGLGWVIGPFVESVPREELEFTLHSVVTALRRLKQ